MTSIAAGPTGTGHGSEPGKYPNRFRASGVKARHLRAHVLVVAWLGLALLAVAAQESLSVARWLAVHMFLLGAVTTAILIWSEHFAVALLHAKIPDARWSAARLVTANLAVAGLLAGVWTARPVLTAISAVLLVAAAAAHLVMLLRLRRGALGGRLGPIVSYYQAATAALIAGALLGWLLATGGAGGPDRYAGLRLAHIHVTLLGWIGLPVLGTLFMLWPTVLGVRMKDRTTKASRWVLWLTGSGLLVATVALALGWRWPAAAGLALYVEGAALAVNLFVRTVRGNRPVSPAAAWMLAAATCWLLIAVAADLAWLVTRPLAAAQAGIDALLPVLLVGFVAQILIGALTYLLPVVLSSGPKDRAAVRTLLERGWLTRLVALNTGVALAALPLPGPAATTGMLLAALAGAAFLALAVPVLVRTSRGLFRDADADKAGVAGRPALWGTAAGVVLTVLAVLVANSGGDTSGGTSAAGTSGADAGTTRTVVVTLADMRIRPARIEVAAGTAVRLKVTNNDAQRHDLKVEDGPATPMLAKGSTRVLDLGQVTENREAWCTLPGHKAAGMTMDIVVKDEKDDTATVSSAHEGHTSAAPDEDDAGLDLSADFSTGWQSRDADLAPVPGGTVHQVELHAAHTTVEVAPGVKQQMWTFGGTAPGPTLRGKVGDVFEVTLVNDDEGMGHGIDFHAGSLAPDKPMRTIQPGERLIYRFRAEKAGAWLYHCSTAPMLQHIGNGMYGAVVIDPPGLAKVDHEYVLVSSELYLGTPGSTAQVTKMRDGTPDAWVFNGIADQYAQQPLKVKAGERARFWVVAAGPGDGIAFHIVGTVFDTVYKEGAHLLKPEQAGGAQVLDLAPAQGGFVETTFPEAGHYPFVDHDMRHAEAGAHGMVEVSD
ncbi:multicopper oxidase domain-containing protein [Streptomyces europaeiscabiei]|uniref:multicopper oxidase domain-containing protein n=1 Tax=Streptomyces europaeiscabiei TaxID=146819 RepID=UPI0029AA20A6|nr:multicopper oxidase domain-containing protein [Streptomyces europaeiscabiei]MDX3714989.1 multicopper oxidase domain-containing protein [Streptomyces europaeiscabiei]